MEPSFFNVSLSGQDMPALFVLLHRPSLTALVHWAKLQPLAVFLFRSTSNVTLLIHQMI
jgi:hypothetical protein